MNTADLSAIVAVQAECNMTCSSFRAVLVVATVFLALTPPLLVARPTSRLQPRFDTDAGIHRLAQVVQIASRRDVMSMGDHRKLLISAGISDESLGDGRVVSARVYCCGGPNEESEAIWAYVPASIDLVVGDVIEVRMGDSKASGSSAAVNVVLAVRAKLDELPAKCHWDPLDEGKWARNLYCEGIEREGWIHRGFTYNMWMKPRDDAENEARIQALATTPATATGVPEAAANTSGELAAGAELFAKGDAPGAFAAWEPFAQVGNPTAQALVLPMYETGVGVSRNDVRAADLHEQLQVSGTNADYQFALSVWQPNADSGDAAAQYVVGRLYLMRGQGGDTTAAIGWLRKSAGQNYGLAEWALGECFAHGDGVKNDEKEAFNWYRRGADHGNSRAAYYVGVSYEKGRGAPRNAAEAARWYRTAAEGGEGEAAHNYANMLDAGQGVARDKALAFEWYRRGAALGSANAANNLGRLYAMGHGVPEDVVQAYQWFSAALSRSTGLQNVERASLNLHRAAGMASSAARIQAKVKLARMCADGQGLPQDDVRAWFWYELVTASQDFRISLANTAEGVAIQQAQAMVAARLQPARLARAQAMARAWAYP